MKITSIKAVVSKDEYKKKYENNSNFFSSEELAHLKDRSSSTGAGFIALKTALKEFTTLTEKIEVSEKDFEISHNDHGAPVLKDVPDCLKDKKIKVSISHTKNEALGLAAGEIDE